MSKKSVTTNLLEFLKKVTRNVDNGDPMDVIYLDFSKAFDKVSKLCLIEKIKSIELDYELVNRQTSLYSLKWILLRLECS